MQIKSIVLYNEQGDIRRLDFKLNAVNIITGRSKSGKSSIIPIIDYCLGRSTFQIAAGVIADKVEWYGLLCQIGGTEVFIAKPKPTAGRSSQSEIYLQISTTVAIPPLAALITNSNDNALIYELSRRIGIAPNLNLPPEGQTREPLEATLAHAKFLLFQPQGVIANRDVLLYRQAEPFMAQAIKDTLPYFLGVVQEDRLRLVRELQEKRRELRLLRRELGEAETNIQQRADRGRTLILEAQQVGLIGGDVVLDEVEDITELLRPLRDWQPSIVPPVVEDKVTALQDELDVLHQEFQDKQFSLEAAELHARYAGAYLNEASEQEVRLESINLFDNGGSSGNICPFCGTPHQVAPVSIEAIARSLQNLQDEIGFVTRERPELDAHIQQLRQDKEDIRRRVQQKEFEIQAVLEEQSAASQYRDTNARIARVVGRISYFLDLTPVTLDYETIELRSKITGVESEIELLEAQLDTTTLEDRKTSILNIIGVEMTRLAKVLELEHQYPYRIDLTRLTVVADRPSAPIIMNQNMGSASNHLGSHLIALLALHKYFIQQNRPVPSFIVLDQPTQVYFPPEKYEQMVGDQNELSDEDRTAVSRMFRVLFDVSTETGLQIIVLEHANLNTAEFQNAIVDTVWRGKYALIPEDWMS